MYAIYIIFLLSLKVGRVIQQECDYHRGRRNKLTYIKVPTILIWVGWQLHVRWDSNLHQSIGDQLLDLSLRQMSPLPKIKFSPAEDDILSPWFCLILLNIAKAYCGLAISENRNAKSLLNKSHLPLG